MASRGWRGRKDRPLNMTSPDSRRRAPKSTSQNSVRPLPTRPARQTISPRRTVIEASCTSGPLEIACASIRASPGGALAGSTSDYLQFFLPGILVQTVVFNSVYSGMGLSTDLSKGLFDRFRSLPIWSLSPFAGLMVGDILRHLIAGLIILTIGLILGYRPEAGIIGVIGAFAMLIAIGFGMGWVFIVLGLLIRTPTTVMTVGFSFLFPLVFASNIMVEPSTMPGWLRAIVEVNPVSLMTTALRGLMGGGVTATEIGLALIAPVALTLLLAPLTLWIYLRRE